MCPMWIKYSYNNYMPLIRPSDKDDLKKNTKNIGANRYTVTFITLSLYINEFLVFIYTQGEVCTVK